MILAIGEILYDIFPGYKRIGGAPFNFAFHAKYLEMPVCFISRVGNDTEGKEIIKRLKQYKFKINHIQIDNKHSTGKVIVKLNSKGVPEFNILPDVAYDHIDFNCVIASLLTETITLIYFGTLAQRSEYGFKTIQNFLSQRQPETKCLYDVNLRPYCFSKRVIVESLKQCDVLKLNDEELKTLKQIFVFEKSSRAFIKHLMVNFDIEMIFLTKGQNGSELFSGGKYYSIKPSKPGNIVDTVGAGDAYTAILSIGYINKWPPEQILDRATEFAARICKIKGAIPTDPYFYQDIIADLKGELNEKK